MSERTCLLEGCEAQHFARGYCGRHLSRANRGLLPYRADEAVDASCAECGAAFTHFPRAAQPKRFCCKRCCIRNARRRQKQRRRAKLRLVRVSEPIDLPTLAERDGWRCHICRKRVTRSNWSVDHLVPISAGGFDTYANVGLAHKDCNSARADRGPAQLRLEASLGVCSPRDIEPKTCAICGAGYTPRSSRQKRYCANKACKREARRRSASASYARASAVHRPCVDCGVGVSPHSDSGRCRACARTSQKAQFLVA
jgi:hypothetical protein